MIPKLAGPAMPALTTSKAHPGTPPRGAETNPQPTGLSADEIRQIVLDIVG